MGFRLVITGQPVAKGRIRFARKTGHAYTPEKTVAYETKLALAAQEKMNGEPPIEGPLKVTVLAEMQIAASWPKWKREAAEHGSVLPVGRPDADNYAKILDSLNFVVWVDDSQIVDLTVRKRYSTQPQLTIDVERIGFFD